MHNPHLSQAVPEGIELLVLQEVPQMPKGGQGDLVKEKYRREKLAEWEVSGLSKTQFCRREGLKLTTFCSWGDAVRRRDKASSDSARSKHKPTTVLTGKAGGVRRRAKKVNQSNSDFDFVKLRLKDEPQPFAHSSESIEIRCQNGVSISLPQQTDLNTLLAILNSLGRWGKDVL